MPTCRRVDRRCCCCCWGLGLMVWGVGGHHVEGKDELTLGIDVHLHQVKEEAVAMKSAGRLRGDTRPARRISDGGVGRHRSEKLHEIVELQRQC
jgi:hypothetical protein